MGRYLGQNVGMKKAQVIQHFGGDLDMLLSQLLYHGEEEVASVAIFSTQLFLAGNYHSSARSIAVLMEGHVEAEEVPQVLRDTICFARQICNHHVSQLLVPRLAHGLYGQVQRGRGVRVGYSKQVANRLRLLHRNHSMTIVKRRCIYN